MWIQRSANRLWLIALPLVLACCTYGHGRWERGPHIFKFHFSDSNDLPLGDVKVVFTDEAGRDYPMMRDEPRFHDHLLWERLCKEWSESKDAEEREAIKALMNDLNQKKLHSVRQWPRFIYPLEEGRYASNESGVLSIVQPSTQSGFIQQQWFLGIKVIDKWPEYWGTKVRFERSGYEVLEMVFIPRTGRLVHESCTEKQAFKLEHDREVEIPVVTVPIQLTRQHRKSTMDSE